MLGTLDELIVDYVSPLFFFSFSLLSWTALLLWLLWHTVCWHSSLLSAAEYKMFSYCRKWLIITYMFFWLSQMNSRNMNTGHLLQHLLWCHYLDWHLRTLTVANWWWPSIHNYDCINTLNKRRVAVEIGCFVWSALFSSALSRRSTARHPNERQNVTAEERLGKQKKLLIYPH